MDSRSFRTHGRLLHFREQRAAGPTIVLLHGVLRNGITFHPLTAALDGRFPLVALDFRGHGKSDWTPHAYRVIDYVEDAVAILRELAGEPMVLYGHSLGAMVALAAAAREPERVQRVILEDPPFSTMGPRLPESDLGRYFAGVRDCVEQAHTVADIYERFSDIVVGTKPDGSPLRVREQRDEPARRFMSECLAAIDHAVLDPIVAGEWINGYDLADIASQISCPVLILQGDPACGGMLREEDLAVLTGELGPLAQVRRFPGVGHQVHATRTAVVAALVRSWLSGEADAGGKDA